MWGVKFKLCAIVLVLHVTRSTESDLQSFLSSHDNEELAKMILNSDSLPENLNGPRENLENVDYDQYYDSNNNDSKDKTRKKRQLIPNGCITPCKCKDYTNDEVLSNEREYKNKLKPSSIWKDHLERLIHKNFVPHRERYDHASGKSTIYYKNFGVSSPANNFNSRITLDYLSSIKDKKHRPHFVSLNHQHNTYSDNLRKLHSETVSDGDVKQIKDTEVVSIDQDIDSNDESHPKSTGSVTLVKYQSNVPQINYFGDNKHQDINKAKITESVTSNTDDLHSANQSSDARFIILSDTYSSVSNGNKANTQKLPSTENYGSMFPRDDQNKINPSIPMLDRPIWSNNKHSFVFMPPSAYEDYMPNTFNLPRYPIHRPSISNDVVPESNDSIYYKSHPFAFNKYYLNRYKQLNSPFQLDEYTINGYNHKYYDYQRPKKYTFLDNQKDQQRPHHLPGMYPPLPPKFPPSDKTRPSLKPIEVNKQPVSYNPKLTGDEYGLAKNDHLKIDHHVSTTVDPKAYYSTPKNKDWPYENYDPEYSTDHTHDYQTASPIIKTSQCGEGTEWTRSCHKCFCNEGGATCTKIENCKLRPYGEPMLCKPYSRFKLDDCYVCECNGDGIPECSIHDCKQQTETTSQHETNKQFYDRPLGRMLEEYNKNYKELSNYCPPQSKIPTCEQWTVWKSSCHECKCNEYGTRECVKLIGCQLHPKQYGKPSNCKPNTTFLLGLPLYSRRCYCNDEGESYCVEPR